MKTKNLLSLFIALISCLAFALAGCNPDDNGGGNSTDNHIYYTVTFDSLGGSTVESQRVMSGNPVVRPETPTRENFTFGGWYKDTATSESWIFETDRVNADITLYAGWRAEEATEATASLTYESNGEGYIVTGVGEEVAVCIPSEYNGRPVTAIGEAAFARKALISVVIPDSVTEIGLNAFNNASSLAQVNIGENSALTTIGNNAFSGNSSLTGIYIPSGVVSIGNSVFNNCGALNSITVAEGNANYYSTGSNLIERATQTLLRGSNTSVIPNEVRVIAQAAFRRSSISSINIPASVTEIGNYAFDDCENLTAINVDDANENYASQDGILYNKAMTEFIMAPDGITGSVTLPATLTELPRNAFDGRENITEVNVPQGALANGIRIYAFRNSGITTVNYGGTESEWAQVIAASHSLWASDTAAGFTVICSDSNTPTPEPTESKILIAYFSATNNTENIANHVADITSGTRYEILPKEPYTSADLNYNTDCRAKREQNDPTCRPAIDGRVADMANYDIVFIGYPIWWGQAPKILYTFLESYEFAGKTIIPFCTSGSSGIGTSATNLSSSASDATWLSGQRFSGSASKATVETWINGLNLNIGQEQEMKISVKSGNIEIIYKLNDSKAAKDLYAQLPLTIAVEPFSNNEIIFYPEKLDTSDAPLADGGAGSLAYYAPWGDVVLFYGSFNRNSSLFELGKIISGVENINKLSGTVTITAC